MKGGIKSWDLLMKSKQERKHDKKTIVLPETEDERTYKASRDST